MQIHVSRGFSKLDFALLPVVNPNAVSITQRGPCTVWLCVWARVRVHVDRSSGSASGQSRE